MGCWSRVKTSDKNTYPADLSEASNPMSNITFQNGIGQTVHRSEDRRLVTGKGCYSDDNKPINLAWMSIVRSLYPHALINGIDSSFAKDMPGVLTILTGEDYKNDGLGEIPCMSIPPEVMDGNWFKTPFPALTKDVVRCVGQAVALVIAETREQAMDAAESIIVDYENQPSVTSVEAAIAEGAITVWPDCKNNISFVHELGCQQATEQAFTQAEHVIKKHIVNQRIAGNPLEPRSYIGYFDEGEQRYHLITGNQSPHRIQTLLAEHIFKIPTCQIHVQCKDVGGGFGTKGNLYPEEALVLWAANRVGRPVKWLSDRSESFLSDFNGRDQIADAELALDKNGKILALRAITYTNMGCQQGPSGAHPPLISARMLSGTYAIPAIHVRVHGVLTHTMTLTTYRGAGRPEATFLLERMIDIAARKFNFDPIEIRRKNMISTSQMPYKTAVDETYDCGEFTQVLDKTVELADWHGFAARQKQSQQKGLLRGRGVSMYIEVCGVLGERMEIRFDASGNATILAGTCASGQGHETVFRQMLVQWLGLPLNCIRVIQGDTDSVSYGRGSYASRSMSIAGSALKMATDEIIKKGKTIAAHLLKKDTDSIEFKQGEFCIKDSNVTLSLTEVAKATYKSSAVHKLPIEFGSGLEGIGYFSAKQQNYPNGCHIAEVEIDPQTGVVKLDRYTAIDESGVIINPLLFHGQTQGGIAQGVGQALMEAVIFNEDGQLITGGFTDYTMPRASHFPNFKLGEHSVPTTSNPLGVKGGGEGGTVGAASTVINAVVDALSVCGVTDIQMPATSLKVWQAIQTAQITN